MYQEQQQAKPKWAATLFIILDWYADHLSALGGKITRAVVFPGEVTIRLVLNTWAYIRNPTLLVTAGMRKSIVLNAVIRSIGTVVLLGATVGLALYISFVFGWLAVLEGYQWGPLLLILAASWLAAGIIAYQIEIRRKDCEWQDFPELGRHDKGIFRPTSLYRAVALAALPLLAFGVVINFGIASGIFIAAAVSPAIYSALRLVRLPIGD